MDRAASAPIACAGVPVAYGDPFGTGFGSLVTVSRDGIELWRGAACEPATMRWSGARGDLWRTGCVLEDGTPLGPMP